MNYLELQLKFHTFVYEKYEYKIENNSLKLAFFYQLVGDETIEFKHQVTYEEVGVKKLNLKKVKELENFIFHIGMVETINYWKTACPKNLKVKCGQLTDSQVQWWKKLYYHGLGEFIYLNGMADQVEEDSFVNITGSGQLYEAVQLSGKGNLIPVGGGKDSVVTLEVLKGEAADNLPFVMSPPQAAYDCIQVAGYDSYLEAKRNFDKRMLEMNDEGYLNGHVPFSAILAFISSFGAALTGTRYIPLSNERSANEPSVHGTTFNHQYSKSFEFEKDFDEYLHAYITKDLDYFSLLRPLYEIKIGEMFAAYTGYHQVYRSCNRGKKDNVWCGVCPKCLFVYIILSPYIPREKLTRQFGKDLLDDEGLIPIFDELIGLKDTKPFECVGTMWEVRYALNQSLETYGEAKLLAYYQTTIGPTLSDQPTEYEEGEFLPQLHRDLLQKEMKRLER